MPHQLVLNPQGHLLLEETDRDVPGAFFSAEPALIDAFARSSAHGLVVLAARPRESADWTAATAFWREYANDYLIALARTSEVDAGGEPPPIDPPPGLFSDLALRIPAMPGAEYASPETFATLWGELSAVIRT